MARADLLISLVKSVTQGDMVSFRRIVENLAADERNKKHHILADRLMSSVNNSKINNFQKLTARTNGATDFIYEKMPERRFDDLVLNKMTRTICYDFIQEHHHTDLLRSYNLEPRNRILLMGPPGNGKTTLAEAIAGHLMYPLFVIRYESLIGSYLGETATRLQKVFEYIRTNNCVLFFDEFDTIAKERGDTKETGEIKRVVSSLLLQVDSLPSYVVVITASNHPELLDKAVWRRFQIKLNLDFPDVSQIRELIEHFTLKTGFSFGYSIDTLVETVKGKSFAEIEDFCKDILRDSILKRQTEKQGKIIANKIKQFKSSATVK